MLTSPGPALPNELAKSSSQVRIGLGLPRYERDSEITKLLSEFPHPLDQDFPIVSSGATSPPLGSSINSSDNLRSSSHISISQILAKGSFKSMSNFESHPDSKKNTSSVYSSSLSTSTRSSLMSASMRSSLSVSTPHSEASELASLDYASSGGPTSGSLSAFSNCESESDRNENSFSLSLNLFTPKEVRDLVAKNASSGAKSNPALANLLKYHIEQQRIRDEAERAAANAERKFLKTKDIEAKSTLEINGTPLASNQQQQNGSSTTLLDRSAVKKNDSEKRSHSALPLSNSSTSSVFSEGPADQGKKKAGLGDRAPRANLDLLQPAKGATGCSLVASASNKNCNNESLCSPAFVETSSGVKQVSSRDIKTARSQSVVIMGSQVLASSASPANHSLPSSEPKKNASLPQKPIKQGNDEDDTGSSAHSSVTEASRQPRLPQPSGLVSVKNEKLARQRATKAGVLGASPTITKNCASVAGNKAGGILKSEFGDFKKENTPKAVINLADQSAAVDSRTARESSRKYAKFLCNRKRNISSGFASRLHKDGDTFSSSGFVQQVSRESANEQVREVFEHLAAYIDLHTTVPLEKASHTTKKRENNTTESRVAAESGQQLGSNTDHLVDSHQGASSAPTSSQAFQAMSNANASPVGAVAAAGASSTAAQNSAPASSSPSSNSPANPALQANVGNLNALGTTSSPHGANSSSVNAGLGPTGGLISPTAANPNASHASSASWPNQSASCSGPVLLSAPTTATLPGMVVTELAPKMEREPASEGLWHVQPENDAPEDLLKYIEETLRVRLDFTTHPNWPYRLPQTVPMVAASARKEFQSEYARNLAQQQQQQQPRPSTGPNQAQKALSSGATAAATASANANSNVGIIKSDKSRTLKSASAPPQSGIKRVPRKSRAIGAVTGKGATTPKVIGERPGWNATAAVVERAEAESNRNDESGSFSNLLLRKTSPAQLRQQKEIARNAVAWYMSPEQWFIKDRLHSKRITPSSSPNSMTASATATADAAAFVGTRNITGGGRDHTVAASGKDTTNSQESDFKNALKLQHRRVLAGTESATMGAAGALASGCPSYAGVGGLKTVNLSKRLQNLIEKSRTETAALEAKYGFGGGGGATAGGAAGPPSNGTSAVAGTPATTS